MNTASRSDSVRGGARATGGQVPFPDAQVHFGVFFQGVNHSTIWSDPSSGSQIDFETFRRTITTAERGLFDAFFLGEGLRLREQNGKLLDTDIAGRPDAIAQLAALAGITRHIGLVATQNTTYNEPADLARRLSGLDLLSGGRAGWNAVTTDNAWTGENFRRGGFLDHAQRYERAGEFISAAREIWDAWADHAIAPTRTGSDWAAPDSIRTVARENEHFQVEITPTLPRSAQGHPVIFQAGDSPRVAISRRPTPMSSSPGTERISTPRWPSRTIFATGSKRRAARPTTSRSCPAPRSCWRSGNPRSRRRRAGCWRVNSPVRPHFRWSARYGVAICPTSIRMARYPRRIHSRE